MVSGLPINFGGCLPLHFGSCKLGSVVVLCFILVAVRLNRCWKDNRDGSYAEW